DAETLVKDTASAEGLAVRITYQDVFEACTNDADAVEILSKSCDDLSLVCNLVQDPQRFSEDFGQFGNGAKSAMFWLGSGIDQPQLHNPDYDFPDALIPVGTNVFLAAIRQVLG
ncbi:MAG: M20/M25/M40 family metallo-hydrolase, partial [Pseudomonadota bacterium]